MWGRDSNISADDAKGRWAFLRSFNSKRLDATTPRWASLARWLELGDAVQTRQIRELAKLAAEWDQRLGQLGGDPCTRPWSTFRPLRLGREEDWSDWLAHLLETSRTGSFAAALFEASTDPLALAEPKVEREEVVQTADQARRADLRIAWTTGAVTHVEVKVGDRSFEKTFDTALALRDAHRGVTQWTDFILLPEDDRDEWLSEAQTHSLARKVEIRTLTWRDVSLALRRTLLAGGDDATWSAWAVAFCGAVEQTLLGHCQLPRPDYMPIRREAAAATAFHQLQLLREALT
jgi:hypothetical protein